MLTGIVLAVGSIAIPIAILYFVGCCACCGREISRWARNCGTLLAGVVAILGALIAFYHLLGLAVGRPA